MKEKKDCRGYLKRSLTQVNGLATDCGLPQRKKPKRAWPNSTRDGLLGRWNHPIRSITAGSMGGWFIVGLVTARPISPNHLDRKSTRLNSSHGRISYAVFCLKQ